MARSALTRGPWSRTRCVCCTVSPAELAVANLAELAAARRGESVAHVVSAAPLTDSQIQRLRGVPATSTAAPSRYRPR